MQIYNPAGPFSSKLPHYLRRFGFTVGLPTANDLIKNTSQVYSATWGFVNPVVVKLTTKTGITCDHLL
ncbi:mCG147412 [Mus musculus]|nr:mCG147412 [Mus musculus]